MRVIEDAMGSKMYDSVLVQLRRQNRIEAGVKADGLFYIRIGYYSGNGLGFLKRERQTLKLYGFRLTFPLKTGFIASRPDRFPVPVRIELRGTSQTGLPDARIISLKHRISKHCYELFPWL